VRRWVVAILVVGWLALGPWLSPQVASAASAPPLDWPVASGHFYTQANGFPLGHSPMGFALVDDAHAAFWSAYQANGGPARLGYPISRRFWWNGYLSQATQKAVLQWEPDQGRVTFANVFDVLSQAGKDTWLQSTDSIPPPVPASFDVGLTWPQIEAHRLALLQSHPALADAYHAVADPLDLYGLPTSLVVDAGPMYVIRLQRAVLQEWKIAEPWASPGLVTVVNAGEVAKAAGILPWQALRPSAPTVGSWSPDSGQYEISGDATWYGPGFVGKAMANGQNYQPLDATTTASNAYPLGSVLEVTSPLTGKSIQVSVRDTGRFAYPDVVDLSPAAFSSLGVPTTTGVMPVDVLLMSVGGTPITTTVESPPDPLPGVPSLPWPTVPPPTPATSSTQSPAS
jgi:hypothetical protein